MDAECLCKELVEVAAVAVVAVQDLGEDSHEIETVFARILQERRRQDEKWGRQHHDPRAWLTILGEEFGEACAEALRWKHPAVRDADTAGSPG